VNESFIQQIMHAPKPDAIDWDELISKCVLALPDLEEAADSNVSSAVNAARKKRKSVVSSPLMNDLSPQKRRKMSTTASGSYFPGNSHLPMFIPTPCAWVLFPDFCKFNIFGIKYLDFCIQFFSLKFSLLVRLSH
jgi:hypothetical protein